METLSLNLFLSKKKIKVSGQWRKLRGQIQAQYVQILDLCWLLRINHAQKTYPKISPQFLPLSSQLPQSLLLLVFTVNSAFVFFFVGLSIIKRERTVGKVLVSSRTQSFPLATYFYGEMITNRQKSDIRDRVLSTCHPNKCLNTVHTSVHCSQRFQPSLRRNCPVQSRASHPASRGSLSSQGQPKDITLLSSLEQPLDPGTNQYTSSTSAPNQVQRT